MKLFRRALAASAALFLSGCILLEGEGFFLSRGGGGEDFPNTVNTLSKTAAEHVATASAWEQVASLQLPALPDLNVFADLRIEPIGLTKGLGNNGLGKRQAGAADGECDTTFYDYSQLEILQHHRGRQIVCDEDSARVRRDTLLFWIRNLPTSGDSAAIVKQVQDSAILIQAWGRVAYKNENRVQTYRAWNFDTAGTLDYGEFVTTTLAGPVRTVQRVRLHGADGAYQKDGAPPAYYELVKTRGLDTLDWQRMTDADGDSAFWDRNSKESKGVVRFTRRAREPSDAPGTRTLNQTMRATLHHVPGKTDSLAAQWYFEQRALTSGASTAFSMRGTGADSVLRAGDTAALAVDTVFAASDSAVRSNAAYRLVLGENPANTAAGALARFSVDKAWRRGKLRALRTEFTPTAPLPTGKPFVGSMSSRSAYSGGDSTYTDGTIDAEGMVLTLRRVTDGKVKVYRVTLDRDGNEKAPMVELPANTVIPGTRADTARAAPAPVRSDTLKAVQDTLRSASPAQRTIPRAP